MAVATGTAMLIGAGVAAASQVASSRSQNKANNDASQFEYKAQTEALDDARAQRELERQDMLYARGRSEENQQYERGRYSDYLNRVSPYENAGRSAITGLSRSLPTPNAIPVGGSGQMVRVRSPRGTVKAVPAQFVEGLVAKGAQVVE